MVVDKCQFGRGVLPIPLKTRLNEATLVIGAIHDAPLAPDHIEPYREVQKVDQFVFTNPPGRKDGFRAGFRALEEKAETKALVQVRFETDDVLGAVSKICRELRNASQK
jgi:hypothetical protein